MITAVAAQQDNLSFFVNDKWHTAASVNYSLYQLPSTLIVNCSSSYIQCTADAWVHSKFKFWYPNLDASLWLKQHYEALLIENEIACDISAYKPVIRGRLVCEQQLNSDRSSSVWIPYVYNAKNCSLHLTVPIISNGMIICIAFTAIFGLMMLIVLCNYLLNCIYIKLPLKDIVRATIYSLYIFILCNAFVASTNTFILIANNLDSNYNCRPGSHTYHLYDTLEFGVVVFAINMAYMFNVIFYITLYN